LSPKGTYIDSPEQAERSSGLEDHLSRELRRSSTRYGVVGKEGASFGLYIYHPVT